MCSLFQRLLSFTSRRRKQIGILAAAFALGASLAGPIWACSCFERPAEEAFEYSDVVFTGYVRQIVEESPIEPNTRILYNRVTFGVFNVWKGTDTDTIVLYTSPGAASCGYRFDAGRTYLVFAKYGQDGTLWTGSCSRTKRIEWAEADYQALGLGDMPPPTPDFWALPARPFLSVSDMDFNGSGRVDFHDFLRFVEALGSSDPEADLDGDGIVAFSDFFLFARFFGQKSRENHVKTIALPGGESMDMIWIEAGSFVMGMTEEEEAHLRALGYSWFDQPRARQVILSRGFYMGRYPVTQSQWHTVMGTEPWKQHPSLTAHPDAPAMMLSYEQAQAFIRTLNEAEGNALYSLPTEAQWEYACRAGTLDVWWFGNDPQELDQYAWYTHTIPARHAQPVGTKRPNPLGLYDILGNVWEWCLDGTNDKLYYRTIPPIFDPVLPSGSTWRYIRGGSSMTGPSRTRCGYRRTSEINYQSRDHGFRIIRIAE